MFAGTKRVHATLSWLFAEGRVGWSSVLRFAILAKVMLAFVIIPIYNAASDLAFSMVRKIETDFRLLLSEEVDYECEYKLIQLFSDKHVQR